MATAQLFAAEGANVVATDVQLQLLEESINSLHAPEGTVLALQLDVSSEENWQAVVQQTIEKFGKIDILVNNAGIHMAKGILETDLNSWNKVLAINTTGVFLGSKAVLPFMQQNGKGSIVNISSIGAMRAGVYSDGGGAAYSASKGAVRSFTKHTAQAFAADNIRANSIHPGAVFTPMMAQGSGIGREEAGRVYAVSTPLPPHLGEPDDIAYGVLYLASDESKYVTGEELIIDGGALTQ